MRGKNGILKRGGTRVRQFAGNEAGSSTIEFVLWVPLFSFLLMLVVDTSFIYMNMTRMENAARDAARRVAIGQSGKDEIVAYVLQKLPDYPYAVSADCSTSDYACVSINLPVASMTSFGVLTAIIGNSFGTDVRVRLESGVTLSQATPVPSAWAVAEHRLPCTVPGRHVVGQMVQMPDNRTAIVG